MKPTRQALRRIAREAANKGHSKRRGPTTYARRRQSYRNRYIIAPVTVEFTQVESTQAKETES